MTRLNEDADINGILVQLPLPKQIDTDRVIAGVCIAKDVDGFHPTKPRSFDERETRVYPLVRPTGNHDPA